MPLDPELSALQVELKMFALPVLYTINSQDIVDIELSFIELLNYRYCLFQGWRTSITVWFTIAVINQANYLR